MPRPQKGDIDKIRQARDGYVTESVTLVVCVKVPLVPVMVRVYVPLGVLVFVVTRRLDDPDVVIEPGLKAPLAPLGNPVTLSTTVPANPPDGLTVTV